MQPQSACVLGDSLDLLARLPSGVFDACIADPPYNMSKKKGLAWAFSKHVTMQEAWDRFSQDEYVDFCAKWIGEVSRVVKPNGNLFLFGTYHNIYTMGFLIQRMDLKILNSVIWVKPNAQPNITCRMLTESSEQMIWVCNNPTKQATKWCFNYADAKEMNGGKQMRNVWEFPLTPRRERVAGHPNQKPESVLKRIVKIATQEGDWILDPFSGSGTTGYSALCEKRRFFHIERDPKYVQAQKERFARGGFEKAVAFLTADEVGPWLAKVRGKTKGEKIRAVDAAGLR
jgi:site-specific DNA-methyltransferase (adenine-specific)